MLINKIKKCERSLENVQTVRSWLSNSDFMARVFCVLPLNVGSKPIIRDGFIKPKDPWCFLKAGHSAFIDKTTSNVSITWLTTKWQWVDGDPHLGISSCVYGICGRGFPNGKDHMNGFSHGSTIGSFLKNRLTLKANRSTAYNIEACWFQISCKAKRKKLN